MLNKHDIIVGLDAIGTLVLGGTGLSVYLSWSGWVDISHVAAAISSVVGLLILVLSYRFKVLENRRKEKEHEAIMRKINSYNQVNDGSELQKP